MKTGVRASYRTAGTQPRHTACMFQPRRMPSANGAGRSHAAQQDQKSTAGNPQKHGGGKTNPTGDSPKPLRGPQGNQESAAAPFSEPWLIWSLGQPMQAASRSRQTDCRDVLNRGETMVKEEPKRRHPHSSPPPETGPKAPKSRREEITL